MQHSEQSWIEMAMWPRPRIEGEVLHSSLLARRDLGQGLERAHALLQGAVDQKPWRTIPIESKKSFQDGFLVRLQGFDNRTLAESLLGKTVVAPRDWFVSPPGKCRTWLKFGAFSARCERPRTGQSRWVFIQRLSGSLVDCV